MWRYGNAGGRKVETKCLPPRVHHVTGNEMIQVREFLGPANAVICGQTTSDDVSDSTGTTDEMVAMDAVDAGKKQSLPMKVLYMFFFYNK